MEPVAPGTEEDVHVSSAGSKKASEQERLLSIRTFLPSGEYGNVFELTYNNGSEHWYCKVCKCPIMGRVFYHERGKRHSIKIANVSKFGQRGPNSGPNEQDDVASIKMAPGEPVPPGFEGEITKVAQIQERLDSFHSGSLLGLEYLLEIQDYDHEKEPSYLCLLCDKKGDPRTVIAHLVSYNHLQGYMQRHFPKTYQALAPYVTRQYKKNWQETMYKIADAIETKYGRLLPHPVDAETFSRKKDELYQIIHLGPHFSEKNGVTFEHLVNKDEITRISNEEDSIPVLENSKKRSPSPPVVLKPKKPRSTGLNRKRSLSSVSSISSSDLSDFEDKRLPRENRNNNRGRFPQERKRRSRSPRPRRYNRRSPSPKKPVLRGESNMPWNRPDYIKSRSEVSVDRAKARNDKLDEFKKLSLAIENDMEKVLKQHKNNPEKHPQYNEEWKIFWNRRYKELQYEGKDVAKYDFKPEWIIYWNDRIVEIHKEEIKEKIDALRRRLGLVSADPSPVSFKIGIKKKSPSDSSKPIPVASQPDQDHEIIIIEDKDDSPSRSHSPWEADSRSRSKPRDKRRSIERRSLERVSRDRDVRRRSRDRYSRRSRERSWDRGSSSRDRHEYRSKDRDYRSREKSWERDIIYHRESRKDPLLDIYKPPPVMRDVTRNPVDYNSIPASPEDEEINIVAVLRLLTALEDKLGSLGPKVVDMLATALAMEKKEANSSETLLDSEINCVLFETIKEKLKGQLHAGLVGYNQEKAFKNAIKKIASLIHLASKRKQEALPKSNTKVDPVKVPGVGTVDKAAIAKQIATALVLQGKTDVTQAELEQLINAVVGMAEASKNSNKPITTASFLETLKGSQSEASTPKVMEPTPSTSSTENQTKDSMDGLSDSDLQTLLQNFKDLSTEEQHGLITYLKKLEAKEPERVEKLRKFVQLGQGDDASECDKETGRLSPFSRKLNHNAESCASQATKNYDDFEEEHTIEEESKKEPKLVPVKIDSDDEDYSYEDVFKAANKNLEESQLVKERKIVEDTIKRDSQEAVELSDAKALIANIMDSISSKPSSATQSINSNDSPKTEPLQKQSPVVDQNFTQSTNQSNINSKSNTNINSNITSSTNPNKNLNSNLNVNVNSNSNVNPHNNTNPNISSNMNHNSSFNSNINPNPQGPRGFTNQFVQYPTKNPNNPYSYQQQFNNFNQFNQNRFSSHQRGNFHNNRGGGNYNNRW